MFYLEIVIAVLSLTFLLTGALLLLDCLRKSRKQKRMDALMWRVRGTR